MGQSGRCILATASFQQPQHYTGTRELGHTDGVFFFSTLCAHTFTHTHTHKCSSEKPFLKSIAFASAHTHTHTHTYTHTHTHIGEGALVKLWPPTLFLCKPPGPSLNLILISLLGFFFPFFWSFSLWPSGILVSGSL